MLHKGRNVKEVWRDIGNDLTRKAREERRSSTSEESYTLQQLSSDFASLGVDATKREAYLSDQEFHDVFGMVKEDFYKLAKWKQNGEKRKHGSQRRC
eukprot:CAMPEP_0197855344 /NCGR_PEP_ID=MMETSP1438-20131217/26470_1 /TAXON_ID=1461541 /ORGANISM="Pterosperma sp., Strain CCMP1384" /LENGTH=96 /DNA_ID=CAMNT_0043470421 /DNA_START=198 /DNA_END=488 /DNA_ORIENTATION=-